VKIDAIFLKIVPQYPIGRSLKIIKIMMVAILENEMLTPQNFYFSKHPFPMNNILHFRKVPPNTLQNLLQVFTCRLKSHMMNSCTNKGFKTRCETNLRTSGECPHKLRAIKCKENFTS
jgi:hypothetical protein